MISRADLLRDRPDDVTAWIRLDLLTRRIVGRRLEEGPSPALERGVRQAHGAPRVDGAAAGELMRDRSPERLRYCVALLTGMAIASVGCTSMTGPQVVPTVPSTRPPSCSPGWVMDANGICQRDAANFGGPGVRFGGQAP